MAAGITEAEVLMAVGITEPHFGSSMERGTHFSARYPAERTDEMTGIMTMTPQEVRVQKIRAHEKDTRAILEREFSASRMSTTKWIEVSECLAEVQVQCRAKFVDFEGGACSLGRFWFVTGDWFDSVAASVFTSISIEWLEINPIQEIHQGLLVKPTRTDHTEKIEKCFRSASIPYHWENSSIRIIGHVRKSIAEKS